LFAFVLEKVIEIAKFAFCLPSFITALAFFHFSPNPTVKSSLFHKNGRSTAYSSGGSL
jgi:hypothetical protein